jgi:hypothetical protein
VLAGRVAGHSPIAARDLAPASTAQTRRRARRPVDGVGHAGGGVADLGEVAEQVTALVGCQRDGRSQPLGNRRNGR